MKDTSKCIEDEISRYRILPRSVKDNIGGYLMPAEFYMIERIRINKGKSFEDKELFERYNNTFISLNNFCSDRWKMGYQEGSGFDTTGFENSRKYLLYRFNGGSEEMFKRFAGFRGDIKFMLLSILSPAEKYLEEMIAEMSIEGEHMTSFSLAKRERWEERNSIAQHLSMLCGKRSSEYIEGAYDEVMKYVNDRLLL
ncbi:hypothetical protein GOV06_00970 [Candidatus Woesearchaeota archaeon]|nr:hypothetical protein [Candidatus Woesearchaeota archaeon]